MSQPLPIFRTRIALALIAAVVVALELTLMRGLAIRLSSHFAGLVISVGLLGFGAAGSFLTLFRSWVMRFQRGALVVLALVLAGSVPLTWWLSQEVVLNVNYLMWNLQTEAPKVLLIELLMLVPFALAGAFIGVVLMDEPRRINGHYAADLLGSGLGGVVAVLAMGLHSTAEILVGVTAAALIAGLLLVTWKSWVQIVAAVVMLVITAGLITQMPWQPTPNPYKPLTLVKNFQGTQEIYHAEGPLGRIDVVEGPMLHGAPQLSLQYFDDLPAHVEMYVDGDGPTLIFDRSKPELWDFVNYRTAALPFFLHSHTITREPSATPATTENALPTSATLFDSPAKVCIIGAGGGVDIGLALRHGTREITALEMNPQVIAAMRGPLKSKGGSIYEEPGVHIINQEARGFFASTTESFDIIQFPPSGGFGAAGSDATQESYYYTTQSIRSMLHHLTPTGVLAMTRGINTPPREELRAFDLAAESLRDEGVDPKTHLAMIRGSFSCTVLLFKAEIREAEVAAIRAFCRRMGFDACYFPGLTEKEANPSFDPKSKVPQYGDFNQVDQPNYTAGPRALLGTLAEREKFLAEYPFDLRAPTDDQPYFFHTFEWSKYGEIHEKYGQGSRGYLEVSYIMLLVSLSQAVLLAVVLILLPMVPGIRSLTRVRGKGATFGYFAMLGLGFMLLEMGFVQKLVLYLSHPIYAAAVVIASFLIFAGLGSYCSTRWRQSKAAGGTVRIVMAAMAVAVGISLVYLLGLDGWLGLTQSWAMPARCAVAALTIGPLAFAMGHFFPMGLQRIATGSPGLVPWGWAVNGFASVVAAAVTPLLAMLFGFSSVVLVAMGCYVLAGVLFRWMPAEGRRSDG